VHLADASVARQDDTRSMSDATGDHHRRNGWSADHAELVLAAKQDRARREELVETFRPLIGSVARRYEGRATIGRQELMQQGVVGLLQALERYDPSLGTPFWAYACWWVRQAMQQMVSELAGPVVLSDRAHRALSRLTAARHAYLQEHRREPTRSDLAAASGLDEGHVDSLMTAARRPRGLDEPVEHLDGPARFGDLLADPRAEEAFECVSSDPAVGRVRAALAHLGERERFVVSGRFGLGGDERTLRAIAADLHLSAERVRQIEQHALEALRTAAIAPPSSAAPTCLH
jgi:RNA polymerase primary sigma factor